MSEVTALIVAVAGHGFRFMNTALGRHAAVEFPERFIGRPTRLIEGDRQIHAVILHALEAADGLAEDYTLARVFVGEFKNFLTGAYLIGAKDRKGFLQGFVDDLPSRAGADDVSSRDFNLIELHFGDSNRKSRMDGGDGNA